MKRTFVHDSPRLKLKMTVEFNKGFPPKPSFCEVWYNTSMTQEQATKEFANWIHHVWTTLKKEGAVMKD